MTEPARLTVGRWQPHAVPVLASSRDATDALLGELRAGGWSLAAWRAFMGRAGRRSSTPRAHPRAVAELTALHAAVALSRGHRRPVWPAVSWALAVTHLGLLGDRRSIGAATALTLLRANLPRSPRRPARRWPAAAVAALAASTSDGTLTGPASPRCSAGTRTRSPTPPSGPGTRPGSPTAGCAPSARPLGRYRPRPSALAAFRGGRMVDPPRPRLLRPAAALQVVLALRGLTHPTRRRRSLGLHGAQHGWGGPGVRAVSGRAPFVGGPEPRVGVCRG